MEKIRVVQFIHGLNMGGAETLVKEYALGLDKEKFEVVILCYDRLDSPYTDILEDAGIPVIYMCDNIPTWKKKGIVARVINHYALYFQTRKWLRVLKPDVVHSHLCLNTYVKFAKLPKTTKLFYTQHFSVSTWKSKYVKDVKAAKYLVHKRGMNVICLDDRMKQEVDILLSSNNTLILNNGVHFDRFLISANKEDLKRRIGINPDSFLVGHVGRLSYLKNHKFIVDIFENIIKKNSNAHLLFVGSGELEREIVAYIKGKQLENHFTLLSNRTDIPELMKAMDVLVFPSLSEGVPVTLIEAQISGLKCIVADNITKYIKISNLVKYESLSESAEVWANEILNWDESEVIYCNENKWDMTTIIRNLQDIYVGAYGDE